jgi:beta-N-acetylhexosaminidase
MAPPLDQMARPARGRGAAMYLRYRIIAAELRAVGIDVNCAPLADVAAT